MRNSKSIFDQQDLHWAILTSCRSVLHLYKHLLPLIYTSSKDDFDMMLPTFDSQGFMNPFMFSILLEKGFYFQLFISILSEVKSTIFAVIVALSYMSHFCTLKPLTLAIGIALWGGEGCRGPSSSGWLLLGRALFHSAFHSPYNTYFTLWFHKLAPKSRKG